jgi:alkyl hydroperoxide reductase subunit AhpC
MEIMMSFLVTKEAPEFSAQAAIKDNSFADTSLLSSRGKYIDESLRVLDALQSTEKHGEVCPANWREGEEAMKPTVEDVVEYLDANAN